MIRKSPRYRTSFPTWFYRTWYETCSVGNPFNSTTTTRIDWTAHESFLSIHITSEIAIQKFEWIVIWSGFFCGSTTMISLQRIPNIAGPLFPEDMRSQKTPTAKPEHIRFSHEKKHPMTYDILCPTHTSEESLTRRGGLFLDLTRRPLLYETLNQISFRNLETPSCSWGASPSSRKIQCCSINIPARIIFLILPPLVGVNHRQIQF